MRMRFPRKTRIIATLGPASREEATIRALLAGGVSIFRLNFSHGTHQDHAENIRRIRTVAADMGLEPGILLDLQGPKIRTGEIENGGILLEKGAMITFTGEPCPGTAERVSISYDRLGEEVAPGGRILLDDGLLEVTVEAVSGKDVQCRVVTGGMLKSRKGVNLPDAALSISPITEKDKEDLFFGIDSGVDFIALSFVRSSAEVASLKKMIHQFGKRIPVIAKIEKAEAVADIDAIIDAADAIMVARGDLGVETAPESVPLVQKMIVEKCGIAGKPVIIATQMLDSMIKNPRPTRAEATDVANAVFSGADAVMLSGETAAGDFPVEAVAMMDRICRNTEKVTYRSGHFRNQRGYGVTGIADAMAFSIAGLAERLEAKYIIAFTYSGKTATILSKYRTSVPVIAMTHNLEVMRQLSLYWGVECLPVREAQTTDDVMEIARMRLLELGLVKPLDTVVISTGVPLSAAGTTNMVRVMQFPREKSDALTGTVEKNGKVMEWVVDKSQCIHCGLCSSICSCDIYTTTRNSISLNSENLKDCFFDLQCMYSCPVGAIIIRPEKEGGQ